MPSVGKLGSWPLFQFHDVFTVGRTPWNGDQPVIRPLPAHRTPQAQNILTQTSMRRMEFEPTTTVFDRAKTVYALGRAATVITLGYLGGSKSTTLRTEVLFSDVV
jgi:hypothetical protein